jgi:hypothetical protein
MRPFSELRERLFRQHPESEANVERIKATLVNGRQTLNGRCVGCDEPLGAPHNPECGLL